MPSYIHHFSLLSGPILTCGLASLYCFVPVHNAITEPYYWYEFHVLTILVCLPFFYGMTMLEGIYWSNFTYENELKSFLVIYGFGAGLYAILASGYYYLWTGILGYQSPLPLAWMVLATITLINVYLINWFR